MLMMLMMMMMMMMMMGGKKELERLLRRKLVENTNDRLINKQDDQERMDWSRPPDSFKYIMFPHGVIGMIGTARF